MHDYEVTITVKGKGEDEYYTQQFWVEADNFDQAVANVEADLDIA